MGCSREKGNMEMGYVGLEVSRSIKIDGLDVEVHQ